MELRLDPTMSTEQKIDIVFDFLKVFERDQEMLIFGMQALLQGKAQEERFNQYVESRTAAVNRIRSAAGMIGLEDEKTDPGMNG